MADNDRNLKRKRRKARAALVILRRNISSICGKAMNAADFYDKVAAYTAPVMSEFGDVLPSDSRSHMDRLMELITERREEAETACNLCKGEVDAAIKGVAAQLGVQGAILSALRPIENVAPQWLVEGPLAEVAAAFVVLLVGGGVAASIAVLASGGGTEEDSSAVTASSPTSIETDSAGDGDGAEGPVALASACDIVTPDDVQQLLISGEAQVSGSDDTAVSSCEYVAAPAPGDCSELTVTLYAPNYSDAPLPWDGAPTISGPGDEAREIDEISIAVRKGELWATFDATCQHDRAISHAAILALANQAVERDWEATAAGEASLGSGVATVGDMEFPFNVTLCSRESIHGPTTESATQAGYVRVFVGDGSSPVAWVAIGGSEDSPDQGDPTYQSLAQNTGELSAINIVYEFGEQLSISFSEQFVERGPLDPPTMPGNVEVTCDSELLQ